MSGNYVKQCWSLMSNYMTESVHLARQVGGLVKKTAKTVSQEGIQNTISPSKLLVRWMDFNIEVTSVVSEQTLKTFKGIVRAAERTMNTSSAPSEKAESVSEKNINLQVKGRQKELVTAPFLVQNQYDREVTITFRAADIVPLKGQALPASHITFAPSEIIMNPGEQIVVQANVQITDDFEIGQIYTTSIRILGFQAKEIGLEITVLPPQKPEKKKSQK